jgi:hypothetical protein
MIDYKLDDLGWSEFEHLIQTVVKARLGLGIEAWGGRGDWGRDAYFAGKLRYPSNEEMDGPFVFQCKFVENANAAGAKPEKLLKNAVRKECTKIRENLECRKWNESPNCYGFFTNAQCTPVLRDSLRALLRKVLPNAHIPIHDGGDFCQWLRLSPEIVRSFPQLASLRDLAGLVLDAGRNNHRIMDQCGAHFTVDLLLMMVLHQPKSLGRTPVDGNRKSQQSVPKRFFAI